MSFSLPSHFPFVTMQQAPIILRWSCRVVGFNAAFSVLGSMNGSRSSLLLTIDCEVVPHDVQLRSLRATKE